MFMSKLNLNRKKAIEYLQKAIDDSLVKNMRLRDDVTLGNGDIVDMYGSLGDSYIGIDGISSDITDCSDVSDKNFVIALISIYHENQHAYQLLNTYQSYQMSDVYMTVSHISQNNNMYYYFGNNHKNYRINPNEIEAEKYGILNAAKYLRNNFIDVDTDILILDYVNQYACNDIFGRKSDYFIHINYFKLLKSINEVDMMFTHALNESKNTCRIYKYDSKSRDEVMSCFTSVGWEDIYAKFKYASTGYQQDIMVASIVNYLHPKECSCYANLQMIDLSAQAIFGIDEFPEISDKTCNICECNTPDWNSSRLYYLANEYCEQMYSCDEWIFNVNEC